MQAKRWRGRGTIVVAILALVGGAFLAGLFLTARSIEPAEYRDSKPGLPVQPIRVVLLDLEWKQVDAAKVAEMLKPARADFVLLQGVSRKDAQALGDALEMRKGGELQMVYSPGNSDDPQRPGNAILGKHGLFKGRVMQRKKADSAGVVGEAVVGGKRFMLASVDLGGPWAKPVDGKRIDQGTKGELDGLKDTWESADGTPLIAGGDWMAASNGEGAMLFSPKVRAVMASAMKAFVTSQDWGEAKEGDFVGEAIVMEFGKAGN